MWMPSAWAGIGAAPVVRHQAGQLAYLLLGEAGQLAALRLGFNRDQRGNVLHQVFGSVVFGVTGCAARSVR